MVISLGCEENSSFTVLSFFLKGNLKESLKNICSAASSGNVTCRFHYLPDDVISGFGRRRHRIHCTQSVEQYRMAVERVSHSGIGKKKNLWPVCL